MPKINKMNGHKAQPEQSKEYELAAQLLGDFRDLWVDKFKRAGADSVLFSRMSVVALTQLSAIIAVDVGMSLEQFVNVCAAQFSEAYKKAPRFGD